MAQIPRADPGLICPFHKRPMEEVCHTCPLWLQIRLKHPQTGADIDEWSCAIRWSTILQIENCRQSMQAGAAVEMMRNEVVKRMDNPMPIPVSRMLGNSS